MADDILIQIRAAFDGVVVYEKNIVLRKASDEIERLRAELAAMKSLAYDRLLQVEAAQVERDATIARAEKAEQEARSWEQQARLKY